MPRNELVSRRDFLGRTAAIGGAVLAGSLPTPTAHSAPAGAAQPLEERWQIGCYTRPWSKFDYRVAMDAIAEAGYKYVGLMTTKGEKAFSTVLSVQSTLDDAVRVGEDAKKRGLSIPSVYFGGIASSRRDAATADLRHLIDLCAAAHARSVLLANVGEVEQAAVADCCDYGAAKNVALTVKPHNPTPVNGPELRKLVEKVGHKNFSVYYDPGNIFHYSHGKINPVDDVAVVDGLVTGLVVKDFSSKLPEGDDVWLTPGTGEVDFPTVFAKLKKGGFTSGPLLVETLLGRGDRTKLLAEAKKTRRFLEALVR